uniref:Uncharacterized protein n=1 Tax=Salmonella sp. TaxID=599 RepID=A0A482ETN8_SALSP|nr:hypothetical protein NNIBIDOC_00152 [Salmonella sp.]
MQKFAASPPAKRFTNTRCQGTICHFLETESSLIRDAGGRPTDSA